MFARNVLFAPFARFGGFLGRTQLGRPALDERFETFMVLAQLQVAHQHLGERVEQSALLGQKRPFRERGPFVEVRDLDQPFTIAGREGRGLRPRRLPPSFR